MTKPAKKKMEKIPLVDPETEMGIGKSLEDIKKGRYVTLSTDKEIEDHFNNL